jgi:hypothetical protein
VVRDQTIYNLVRALGHSSNGYTPGMAGGGGPRPGPDIQARLEAKTLGQDLLAMNQDAVRARYGDRGLEGDWGRATYTPARPTALTPITIYANLRCYLYQCSEGDIPQRQLYKELDEFLNELAHAIIMRSAEFSEAGWDA